jgi:hypothetical protein
MVIQYYPRILPVPRTVLKQVFVWVITIIVKSARHECRSAPIEVEAPPNMHINQTLLSIRSIAVEVETHKRLQISRSLFI